MPKSKLRKNRRVTALGNNLGQRKLTRADVKRKEDAYYDKVEKYSKLSLDDCLEMYTDHVVGGIYRDALLTVIKQKREEKEVEPSKELK